MAGSLNQLLERSRELGFLGPGDPAGHRRHAESLGDAYEGYHGGPPPSFCDLGSGGGVPGLVLALKWEHAEGALLEASSRRCRFLREAVEDLGLSTRVTVHEGRAEDLARTSALGGAFELVVARSFGPPAVTAECAVRLLAPAGTLLVTEPPLPAAAAPRWPPAGLELLGLGPAVMIGQDPHAVAIPRTGPCPERYPRRDGVPSKHPLF